VWMYLGQSYPDRPSSKELGAIEVDTRIHKVMYVKVNSNPRAGLVPLWRGVASARVSMLGPVLAAFTILSFHYICNLA
jgi:hypothetical protein